MSVVIFINMEATQTLSGEDIKQKMQKNEDVILIDTLSMESFCARHIPGSINMPVEKIKELAEIVLPDKNQTLIAYCANSACMKSVEATEKFTELGYKNVLHYSEGLSGWLKEGHKLVGTGQAIPNEC